MAEMAAIAGTMTVMGRALFILVIKAGVRTLST
jgi:hypothetical protein